jgi:hypothetical protein
MEPGQREVEASRLYQILDELNGLRTEPDGSAWRGYDRRAYGKVLSQPELDALTAQVCDRLKAMKPAAIRKRSLELQTWWRDHQRADKVRAKAEAEAEKAKQVAAKALRKLTAAERRALGVKGD